MKNKHVTLIDYGASNLLNVQHAFEFIGAKVEIAKTAQQIENAERIVFPGVGSFPQAISQLNKQHLKEVIIRSAVEKPFLGICLGMQMMLSKSDEFKETLGLDLLSGSVRKLPTKNTLNEPLIIPNTGWRNITHLENNHPILADIPSESAFYFVHSYHAKLTNPQYLLSTTAHSGIPISAIIAKKNMIGCQFHPEKSGLQGLTLLSNFLKLS